MPLKGFIRLDSSGDPRQACGSLAPPGSRQEIIMLLALHADGHEDDQAQAAANEIVRGLCVDRQRSKESLMLIIDALSSATPPPTYNARACRGVPRTWSERSTRRPEA
jgi:hypothetical protein